MLEIGMKDGKNVAVTASQKIEYLTVPDLVEKWDSTPGKIRRMIQQRQLAARRIDGGLSIPLLFIDGSEPLPALQGTLVLLSDAGYSDEEAIDWLFSADAGMDIPPVEALRNGRKTEVRRVAQGLAF